MGYTATSSNGSTYNANSQKAINFIENAAIGSTMTGGDGSSWTKNADGSTTVVARDGVTTNFGGSGNSSATAAEPMYTIRVNGATTGGISGDERAAQVAQQNKQAQLAVQYQQQLAAQQAEYERQKREAEELLRQQKAAELEASLSNLANAYQQNMNGYNQQAALLPQTYSDARNAAAAQNAQAGREFDERALAMGLSSGARGQAQLSRSAAYQNAMTQIDQQQANAQSDIDLAKNNLTTNYNNTVANARAQNSAQLTDALYNELVRQEEQQRSDLQRAQQYQLQLAQLAQGVGDYSLLNQLGINTSAYEQQQASLAAQAAAETAAYKPTFTQAQVLSAAQNAAKTGEQLTGNLLRDFNYYQYGDPNYGTGDTSAAVSALTGNGTPTTSTGGGKTVDELAREVIAGKWGNGTDRKNALAAAGYDAAAVQARVNQLMPSTPSAPVETSPLTGSTMSSSAALNEAVASSSLQTEQLKYLNTLYVQGRITLQQRNDLAYAITNPSK